jgi:hypothetical protein
MKFDDDIVGIVTPSTASVGSDAVKWYFEEPQLDRWVDIEYGSFAAKAAGVERQRLRAEERPDARLASGRVLLLDADSPERRRIDAIRVNVEDD